MTMASPEAAGVAVKEEEMHDSYPDFMLAMASYQQWHGRKLAI